MKDFKELRVWSKAHELTMLVYKLTRAFPRDEVYGLTSQVRRSAASIGANIVEGCGRHSDGEMTRFLQIARGSASETEYHLLLAKDLGFLQEGDFQAAEQSVVAVQRMLTALVQKVQPQGRRPKPEHRLEVLDRQ
ncbi:MAG: four helix bundle protein [Terriglobales bacterium]